MKRLLLMLCLILAYLSMTGQNYADYYKGDTLIKADKNTYSIKYTDLSKNKIAYIYVNNINNRKVNVKILWGAYILQDRNVFSDVIRDIFTQEELKAMYNEQMAIFKPYPYLDCSRAFTFGVSVNKYTERIETFMVDFCDTPGRRNISLKKIEQLESQLREKVRFKAYEGRIQFLKDADVFFYDYVRVLFKDVIDDFGSLKEQ